MNAPYFRSMAYSKTFSVSVLIALAFLNGSAHADTIKWTGGVNTDWNTAGNWDLNRVPTDSDDVSIPNTAPNVITIDLNATCHSITIESGGNRPRTISLGAGIFLTVKNIAGDPIGRDAIVINGGSSSSPTRVIDAANGNLVVEQGNIALKGGSTGRLAILRVQNGTIQVLLGNISFLNIQSQFQITDVFGVLEIGGMLGTGGAVDVSKGVVRFIGTAAQLIPETFITGSYTYSTLDIRNSFGVTPVGNISANKIIVSNNGIFNELVGSTITPLGTSSLEILGGVYVCKNKFLPTFASTNLLGGTVEYAGSNQTVAALPYGNLTFSSDAKTLANTENIDIAGNFNPGTATHIVNGSTIRYNGTDQLVADLKSADLQNVGYNNLQLLGTGAKTGSTSINAAALYIEATTSFKLGGASSATTLSGTGPIDLQTFDLSISSGSFDGPISGIGGITKVGLDTLTLSATSSFTGPTAVTSGTLEVNGSTSTSSLTTVSNGATLRGQGAVGNLSVSSGGLINPGTSLGVLNSGNTSFSSGSKLVIELNGPTPGAEYDLLNVRGKLDLAGADLVVSCSTLYLPELGSAFTIAKSIGALSGAFSQGMQVAGAAGEIYAIDYSTSQIVVTRKDPVIFSVDDVASTVTDQAIQLKATFTSPINLNEGTVDFNVPGIGSVSGVVLINGVATATIDIPNNTTPNTFSIFAIYSGSSNYVSGAASASATLDSDAGQPGEVKSFKIETIENATIGDQQAGVNFSVRITALDVNDAIATAFDSTVVITSNADLDYAPLTSDNFVSGILNATSVKLTKAMPSAMIFVDGGGKSGTSNAFAVISSNANYFTVTSSTSSTEAGNSITAVITAYDEYRNVAHYNSAHDIIFTGPGLAPNPTDAVTDWKPTVDGSLFSTATSIEFSEGISDPIAIRLVKAESITIEAEDALNSISTQKAHGHGLSVLVSPATASKLALVDSPTVSKAGDINSATAESQDLFGNSSDVSQNTDFALTLATGTLSKFTGLPATILAGSHLQTTTFIHVKSEDIKIRAEDTTQQEPHLSSSPTFDVHIVANAPFALGFAQSPADTEAGVAIKSVSSSPLRVQILDQYENPVFESEASVSISLTTGTGSIDVSSTTTALTVNGIATFSDLVITNPGSKILTASSMGLSPVVSPAFNIVPGLAKSFYIQGAVTQIAGTPNDLTITAKDLFGNVATSYSGTRTIVFAEAEASPGGNKPYVTDNGGIPIDFGAPTLLDFDAGISSVTAEGSQSGSITLYAAGMVEIKVEDRISTPNVATMDADKLVVTVLPSSLNNFQVNLKSPQQTGSYFTESVADKNTLTACDQFLNTVTEFSPDNLINKVLLTVEGGTTDDVLTVDSGPAELTTPGDFVLGVANLTGRLKYSNSMPRTASTKFIRAKLSGTPAIFGLSDGIIIKPIPKRTPVFSNLFASTIHYGDSATLSGTISDGTYIPSGMVAIQVGTLPIIYTSIDSTTGSFSTNYDTGSLAVVADGYPVTYSYDGDENFETVSDGAQKLTVNPLSITITASSDSRVYGTPNNYGERTTAFAVAALPLPNGDAIDSIEITPSGGNAAPDSVKDYTGVLVPSAAIGAQFNSSNYDIEYVAGTLTVTPATIMVAADNKTKVFNSVNPALTFTYSGFANGQSSSVVVGAPLLVSTATTTSSVGTFPIIVSLTGVSAPNYTVVAQDATLTITPITSTIESVTPAVGPTRGSTTITLSGTNLLAGSTVTLGGVAATSVSLSGSQITAVTPAHATGKVDVILSNPNAVTFTLTNGFEYNDPPSSPSGLTLNPTVAVAGQSITATVPSVDPESKPLAITYIWGDSTSGTSNTHIYSVPGVYTLKVDVSDGFNTVTSTITVTVIAPALPGGEIDSDTDGISDAEEIAANTNPQDAASKPADNGAAPLTLSVTKLQIKLTFSKTGKDSILVTGSLPAQTDLILQNQAIIVNVGGVVRPFTLGKSGKQKLGADTIALTKPKGGLSKFSVKFSKGTYADLLADENLSSTTPTGTKTAVKVNVIFNGKLYQKFQPQLYKKTGKTGGATK